LRGQQVQAQWICIHLLLFFPQGCQLLLQGYFDIFLHGSQLLPLIFFSFLEGNEEVDFGFGFLELDD
jgi:hypothetical protein